MKSSAMAKELNWVGNGTIKPYYIRKIWSAEKNISKATVRVCGLGQFTLYINGEKVGDHELDPGWTDYNRYVQYVSFDVTSMLGQGKNVFAAEVGNGWFIAEQQDPALKSADGGYTFSMLDVMGRNPNPYKRYGNCLPFGFEAEVVFEDGAVETIVSDETWKTCSHAVTMSNVYGSEICDGRRIPQGWLSQDFEDAAWQKAVLIAEEDVPKGKLEEQFQPPIKVIGRYEGKPIGHMAAGTVIDLGQNMAGILTLRVMGKAGDVVRIYPAEKLKADGDVDQTAKGWCEVNDVITYIIGSDDTPEAFRQTFTYFAGRYLRVEHPSSAQLIGVEADAISSAWKRDGRFTASDEKLNSIYDMIEKTVEANMVSVHTDCPTIERFAWQEPNHLMAPSIFYMKDGNLLWRKFLKDMREGQHTAQDVFYDREGHVIHPGDGLIPAQAPCYIPNVLPVPGMGSFYDIIPWGSSIILGTKWHYLFYGDVSVIEENYAAGAKYFDYLMTKETPDGFINHGLGDWGNPKMLLTRENVETAFYYADADALRYFAQTLGLQEDAEKYRAIAERIKDIYNAKLLASDPEGHYFYRVWDHPEENLATQTVEALPLYFGIVPDEIRPDVEKAFVRTLKEEGSFSAGEVGLPYIIQTASRLGLHQMIYDFITKEQHPSYYAFVKAGETTLGEYWEDNPRSHCHDMMGHIIEWYYQGLCGIESLEPGFKRVRVCPNLPEQVDSIECSYASASGSIHVRACRVNGEVKTEISVDGDVALA